MTERQRDEEDEPARIEDDSLESEDERIDEASEESFPASDPPAIGVSSPSPTKSRRGARP